MSPYSGARCRSFALSYLLSDACGRRPVKRRRLVLPEIAAIIEKKRNRTLRRGTLFAAAFGLTGSPERKSGLSYYLLGIKGSLTIRAATGFSRMTTAIGVPGSA